jgi:serine/threonine protein kinase
MTWNPGHLLKAGQYEVVRQLGSGGFGVTYLANDTHLLRKVVIKRPNLSFHIDQNYDEFLRRFTREGNILNGLIIPNVVQIIELITVDRMPCIVMEFVEGKTLNSLQFKMSNSEIEKLFYILADALDSLHQKEIIHCDIHPGNIMINPHNEPVLIDFGSAKLLHPTSWTVTTTRNDNYSPYEQVAKGDELDSQPQPNWDIYSLAATMFFIATGEKPKSALSRKLYGDSFEQPMKINPYLSHEINQMILQGMALESINRPSSIKEWKSSIIVKKIRSNSLFYKTTNVLSKVAKMIIFNRMTNILSKVTQNMIVTLSSPWSGLSLIFLGYLVNGVVLQNYPLVFASAFILGWILAWNQIGKENWFWNLFSVFTLAVISALSLNWSLSGACFIVLVGAFILEISLPSVNQNGFWVVILALSTGVLSIGLICYSSGVDFSRIIVYGLITTVSFAAMTIGYGRRVNNFQIGHGDETSLGVIILYGIFSSIGLISGGMLGSWLKVAGIIKLP